jgi:hypothetical protein
LLKPRHSTVKPRRSRASRSHGRHRVRGHSTRLRAALGQCDPSPLACRNTSAPGRAARGPRRDFAPQAQAAQQLFKMRRRRREATARDPNLPKVHRREEQLTTVHIKLVILTLSRCKSSELFFSCCASVWALPALANYSDHVTKAYIWKPRPPTSSAFCTAPTDREIAVAKPLDSLDRETRTGATGISCFPCQTYTLSFFRFSSLPPPFISRVLPASRLLLRARLRTCRRVSAVTRWAPSFGRWCATRTA